ncbi:SCS2 [Candida jiufengensis]|uniref:SCS2 n=1 Tax=Candida jiufengensis TaxID=497108 RepID=UPI0022246CAF|nr:SCS2 [Candida jiufengensis]KAI5956974.1 SCS2 [Candida jiufengensis]
MEVSPATLEFTGSFTKQTTEHLTLSNPTNQPLAFKVKTTAPKLYCVRPNASIVQPGDSISISIILQGFAQPLPQDYKCKDKFLLVSVPTTQNIDPSKVGDLWGSLESQNKSAVISKKLRVNYIIGPDKPDTSSNQNGTAIGGGAATSGGQNNYQQQPPQQPPQQQYQQQPQISQQNSFGGAGAGLATGALGGAGAAGAYNHSQQQHQPQPPQQQQQQQYQQPPQQQQQHHQPQQDYNSSYTNQSTGNDYGAQNRSFNDTSSINNYNGGYQQHQQQPQLHQQPSYQNSYGQQQQQQPQSGASPAVQRELEALARQVQTLSTKLDQNEKAATSRGVGAIVDSDLASNGISLPIALVLILIAFLIGWLVF